IRFTVASLTMLLLLRLRGESPLVDREDRRGAVWLGILANTIYPFFFVLGLDRTTAGNAALLMALTPVFAFLIGVVMKREHFSSGVLLGILLSISGAAAIVVLGSSTFSLGGSWVGDSLMIGAAVC